MGKFWTAEQCARGSVLIYSVDGHVLKRVETRIPINNARRLCELYNSGVPSRY